ncbi:MAG: hypothetical protein OEO79_03655 [Gemmatimonadota bacterium]|nr:hypothetical protein [Gemmatimonadota bacterium]MDH3421897.1 hypothetical protein [Gemmatimonadota bacterium]
MTRATIAGRASVIALVVLALVAGYRALDRGLEPAAPTAPPVASSGVHEGLLYARVTTVQGSIYEGRIRWGGDQEALWGNHFNGAKEANPWASHVPPGQLPKERLSIEVLGIHIASWEREADLGRPFLARMGDIALVELRAREIRVTLKSGSVFVLDRFGSDDVADGVRVWDATRGVVDLHERQIRSLEFLPSSRAGDAPYPLHGTVRTQRGDFTGFVHWNRQAGLDSDKLWGRTDDAEVSLGFATIRSIERVSRDSSLVTLLDGSDVVLSGTREVGTGNRGIYVDDLRYGRVLISWNAFERVDFSSGGAGPAYGDFLPGGPLTGSVTTTAGQRLTGRLVFDLDESETTETLDAPSQGVDYTIAFELIASIAPFEVAESERARVTLRSGEVLRLDRTGDLAETNAGMLIFVRGRPRPEYVPWTDVEKVEFNSTPVTDASGTPA